MRTMMNRLLLFLRLTDSDGTLSLTSVTLLVAVARFAMTPTLDTPTLLALLGAIASYQGKKMINGRTANTAHATQVKTLGDLISDMSKRLVVLENRTAPQARR